MNRRTATALFSLPLAGLAAGLVWAAEGYTDTPRQPNGKWHVHDPARPQPPVVTPGKQFSQKADAPSDAVVLFDGKDFSKWQAGRGGGEVKWKIENDYMEVVPRTGIIRTKDEFGDFQLHLEFATPEKVNPNEKGQGRGNNGVNIYGRYEIWSAPRARPASGRPTTSSSRARAGTTAARSPARPAPPSSTTAS